VALTWTDRVIPQLTWSVPFAISASLFSNLVTSVFETSRTSYIASRNGQLPLLCSTLNVHSSPFIAVLLDVSMGSIAIVLTNLIELINYLFFVFSIWTVLSVIGILKLRYQEPNLHRPYKVRVGWVNLFHMKYDTCLYLNGIFGRSTRYVLLLSKLRSKYG